MKIKQTQSIFDPQYQQLVQLGAALARLRLARRIKQADAALRAGMARSTAALIEKGSPSVAVGQIVRYLDAIAPNKSLLSLLNEDDGALVTLSLSEQRMRARSLSANELKRLDF